VAEAEPPVVTSASAAPAVPAPPAGYPECGGQRLAVSTLPPRSGAVSVQLAPAFLDELPQCKVEDAAPKDVIARAGAGTIDGNGDCVFSSVGVSCHYHSGSEFVTKDTKAQTAGQGELHCIFPSDDPKSPHVFGAHVACTDPARQKPAPHTAEHGAHTTGHGTHTGAACSAAILEQLSTCQSSRCCDDGTLTGAIADLMQSGKNDIRPDFRICEPPVTLDCSLLENMSAHTANSPALGGIGEPVFGVTPPPAPKKSAAHG